MQRGYAGSNVGVAVRGEQVRYLHPGAGVREIKDVQIYAQRGEKQKALLALREAVDAGYRVGWWWEIKLKPEMESFT